MAYDANNPAQTVLSELDKHIRSIKGLLNQLEPVQRLQFVNEMMVRLLPSHNSADSAQDKLSRHHRSPVLLSDEEKSLIEKLGKSTDKLYRSMQDDDMN